MWPVPVVEVVPEWQCKATSVRVVVGSTVRPFAHCGLDESLGLAIGLRAVGARELLGNAALEASFTKQRRSEAIAVVCDHALNRHAQLRKVAQRGAQEADCAVLAL